MPSHPILPYIWLSVVLPVMTLAAGWICTTIFAQMMRGDAIFDSREDYALTQRRTAVRALPLCVVACLAGYWMGSTGDELADIAFWPCSALFHVSWVYLWFRPRQEAIMPCTIAMATGMAAMGGIYFALEQ